MTKLLELDLAPAVQALPSDPAEILPGRVASYVWDMEEGVRARALNDSVVGETLLEGTGEELTGRDAAGLFARAVEEFRNNGSDKFTLEAGVLETDQSVLIRAVVRVAFTVGYVFLQGLSGVRVFARIREDAGDRIEVHGSDGSNSLTATLAAGEHADAAWHCIAFQFDRAAGVVRVASDVGSEEVAHPAGSVFGPNVHEVCRGRVPFANAGAMQIAHYAIMLGADAEGDLSDLGWTHGRVPAELTTHVRSGAVSVLVGTDSDGPIVGTWSAHQFAGEELGGELGLASWSEATNLLAESHRVQNWATPVNATVSTAVADLADSLRRFRESALITADLDGGYVPQTFATDPETEYSLTAYLRRRSAGTVTGRIALYDATIRSLSLDRSLSQSASISEDAQTALDFSDAATAALGAWMSVASLPAAGEHYTAFSKFKSLEGGYMIRIAESGGAYLVRVVVGRSSGNTAYDWEIPLSVGDWFHVLVNVDLSAEAGSLMELFLNGASQGSGTEVQADTLRIGDSTTGFYVGRGAVSAVQFFDGLIDDVFVGAQPLTASEIATLKDEGPKPTTPGIKDGWRFDGDFTSVANGNTLTNDGTTFSADTPYDVETASQAFSLDDDAWSDRVELTATTAAGQTSSELRVVLDNAGDALSVDLAGAWAGPPPSIPGVYTYGAAATSGAPTYAATVPGGFPVARGDVAIRGALRKLPAAGQTATLWSSSGISLTVDDAGQLRLVITDSGGATVQDIQSAAIAVGQQVEVRARWNSTGPLPGAGVSAILTVDGVATSGTLATWTPAAAEGDVDLAGGLDGNLTELTVAELDLEPMRRVVLRRRHDQPILKIRGQRHMRLHVARGEAGPIPFDVYEPDGRTPREGGVADITEIKLAVQDASGVEVLAKTLSTGGFSIPDPAQPEIRLNLVQSDTESLETGEGHYTYDAWIFRDGGEQWQRIGPEPFVVGERVVTP